ncbi:MAG: cyclic lactone autoinducer peptide [Lachnospiraceae bacterium]|nr:cyclic lactone autoinducer peptide [Lachnospiraceae bacterium]
MKKIEKAIVILAKKKAIIEANSACTLWGYQPKEPKEVEKLCRFKNDK